jgi:hypothetical protein
MMQQTAKTVRAAWILSLDFEISIDGLSAGIAFMKRQ